MTSNQLIKLKRLQTIFQSKHNCRTGQTLCEILSVGPCLESSQFIKVQKASCTLRKLKPIMYSENNYLFKFFKLLSAIKHYISQIETRAFKPALSHPPVTSFIGLKQRYVFSLHFIRIKRVISKLTNTFRFFKKNFCVIFDSNRNL